MRMEISSSSCKIHQSKNEYQKSIDLAKISFIVKSKFRKTTKRRFLGYVWLVLDPFIISMIYLFVFSVVKANPNASSILLGVTLYRVFQASIIGGTRCLNNLNGGFKAERVSTKIVILSELTYRVIDVFLQTVLIFTILVLAFGMGFFDGLIFLVIAQLMGLLFFGFGVSISPLLQKVPDFQNVISYGLRLGFYVSPAMYPMERMEGFHYHFNQFNPFAYFAELSRHLAGIDSVFFDLDPRIFIAFLSCLLLLTLIGFRRVDSLRWRMTTWS